MTSVPRIQSLSRISRSSSAVFRLIRSLLVPVKSDDRPPSISSAPPRVTYSLILEPVLENESWMIARTALSCAIRAVSRSLTRCSSGGRSDAWVDAAASGVGAGRPGGAGARAKARARMGLSAGGFSVPVSKARGLGGTAGGGSGRRVAAVSRTDNRSASSLFFAISSWMARLISATSLLVAAHAEGQKPDPAQTSARTATRAARAVPVRKNRGLMAKSLRGFQLRGARGRVQTRHQADKSSHHRRQERRQRIKHRGPDLIR